MEKQSHIFMVEDDLNFGTVMKSYLEIHNFEVTWVTDGSLAISAFKNGSYDLCILDVMLPNLDGFGVAALIREVTVDIPLIFLTAKTLKEDILMGFKLGADDYVTKPFDSEILIAKINALLARNAMRQASLAQSDAKEFQLGKLHFNAEMRTVTTPTEVFTLSPKESALLYMLCVEKNKILQREKALVQIWGDNTYFTTRSMDVFITKLRKYLKEEPSIEIINIHGSGYQLKETAV